jgi:hypothetical protein
VELRSETTLWDGHVEWIVFEKDPSTKHYGLLETEHYPARMQVYLMDINDVDDSEYYYTVPSNWEIV